MKATAKHQAWRWIETIYECQQSFSRNAEVDNRDHNDEKEFNDNYHDHQRRKKLVVHVVNMMQSEQHQHRRDVVDCIETKYEATMRAHEHHVCRVKQQMITRCNQDCISDIEIRDEWRISNVYQSIASHADFESNCDWWMSCDVKWTTQFSMTDATVERFDEREDADDFVDDDIIAQQRKRAVKQNELQEDKDDVVSSQNDSKEREISSDRSEEWWTKEERRIHCSDDEESNERLCQRKNRDVLQQHEKDDEVDKSIRLWELLSSCETEEWKVEKISRWWWESDCDNECIEIENRHTRHSSHHSCWWVYLKWVMILSSEYHCFWRGN